MEEFDAFSARSKHSDCSDVIGDSKAREIITRAIAAIRRVSGRDSPYSDQVAVISKTLNNYYPHWGLLQYMGIVRSLSADIKAGYLVSFEELVHAEMFADFLDMASHLLDSGYKDAAAVIAGSSLEEHLRQLGKKVGVPIENVTPKGTEPKKADTLNSDLYRAGAYTLLDRKSVLAWLDLRNKAAHGKYGEYQKEQVALQIDGIRNFIARLPA